MKIGSVNPEFSGLDIVEPPRSRKMGLADRFNFGKHRGSTVLEVMECDPSYVQWAADTLDHVEFAPEVTRWLQDVEDDETCMAVDRSFR